MIHLPEVDGLPLIDEWARDKKYTDTGQLLKDTA